MLKRGRRGVVLTAIGVAAATTAACGSSPPSGSGLSVHAGPDVKATLALVGAGARQIYRADYVVTGSGSSVGTVEHLVVTQRPPRASISSGATSVYTSSAASDQSASTPVPGAVVCRAPVSGPIVCRSDRTGATGSAESLGAPVSRRGMLTMLEQDAQLIEEGNPGDMLRSVARWQEVVAGLPSTCLRAVLSAHTQVVCLTTTGIPTLVTELASSATVDELSPTVSGIDLVPPVAVTSPNA